jgi:hypothetical protein
MTRSKLRYRDLSFSLRDAENGLVLYIGTGWFIFRRNKRIIGKTPEEVFAQAAKVVKEMVGE